MKAPDLIGKKYHELTVIGRAGTDKFRRAMWECSCSCGGKAIAATQDLRSGNVRRCKSCTRRGRFPVKSMTFNGETKTYKEWESATGVPAYIIDTRRRRGWSEYDILTKPIRPRRRLYE